jgi:hypothetical protein
MKLGLWDFPFPREVPESHEISVGSLGILLYNWKLATVASWKEVFDPNDPETRDSL